MSKVFVLTGCVTLATMGKLFNAGEVYTAEQVGDLADSTFEDGTPYFTEEAVEGEAPASTSRVVIKGKGTKTPEVKDTEPEGDGEEGAVQV